MAEIIAENLFTVPSIQSSAECADLIARGEAMGFEAASVATGAGPQMLTNIRNNDRVTFDDPAYAQTLWERAKQHVPDASTTVNPIGLNERFRFYRYDSAQRFKGHRDGVVERSPTERSRLTFMIYLNENFEGGQTVFYSESRINGLREMVASIEPRTGMGLFFAHEWWHEGAPVLTGRKYVLRTDVMFKAG